MLVNRRIEKETADSFINKLSIMTPSADQIKKKLRGGNQQKVVEDRWLSLRPKVLMVSEPKHWLTRG